MLLEFTSTFAVEYVCSIKTSLAFIAAAYPTAPPAKAPASEFTITLPDTLELLIFPPDWYAVIPPAYIVL